MGSKDIKPQADKFKDLAREIEADESEERFDRALKKIGKKKRDPKIVGKGTSPAD